jgi:hypothetical protein
LNPYVPFSLALCLVKALEIDREDRYPSAFEMREAIQRAVTDAKYQPLDKGIAASNDRFGIGEQHQKLKLAMQAETEQLADSSDRQDLSCDVTPRSDLLTTPSFTPPETQLAPKDIFATHIADLPSERSRSPRNGGNELESEMNCDAGFANANSPLPPEAVSFEERLFEDKEDSSPKFSSTQVLDEIVDPSIGRNKFEFASAAQSFPVWIATTSLVALIAVGGIIGLFWLRDPGTTDDLQPAVSTSNMVIAQPPPSPAVEQPPPQESAPATLLNERNSIFNGEKPNQTTNSPNRPSTKESEKRAKVTSEPTPQKSKEQKKKITFDDLLKDN